MLDGSAKFIATVLGGIDDDDDGDATIIGSDDEFAAVLGAAAKQGSSKGMLSVLSNAKISPKASLSKSFSNQAKVIGRLASVSKQVLAQTGRIEADYLRRPNTLCAVYTPNLASGLSSAFSIVPGSGNSFYRILGFVVSDDQANVFGFSSLKVGGQDHVQMNQTTPTAPVANAVPWTIYQLKESRMIANLAPWTGQVFDNSTPVQGTITNMTTAGAGDTVTLAARVVILTQTDPCGYRYTQLTENSRGYWKQMRRNIGSYAPLMAFR